MDGEPRRRPRLPGFFSHEVEPLHEIEHIPRGAGRWAVAVLIIAAVQVLGAAQPDPAALTAVDLVESTHESCFVMLEVQGSIDRVETMSLGDGRYVFDLSGVVWDGPLRRMRPGAPGVSEYRFSQLSLDPLITRFVVVATEGWSCRHERAPRGLLVVCSGPAATGAPEMTALDPDIAVVRGIGLMSPVVGLDTEALIDRSLGFVPRDMVRDGLPNYGSMRDDWLGAPRSHKGLDIYGDKAIVRAAAEGKVAGAGRGTKAGGWVKILHGNGVETVYVHISNLSVRIGETVAKGRHIATIDGPAGNAVQAQLHFELKLDGQSVDPVPFIFELASEDLRQKMTLAIQKLALLEQERATRVEKGIE